MKIASFMLRRYACAPYLASKDHFIATLTKHYAEVFPSYPNAARFGPGWAGSALILLPSWKGRTRFRQNIHDVWLEMGASVLQTEDLSHFQYLSVLLTTPSICQIATCERPNLCHIKPFVHPHG